MVFAQALKKAANQKPDKLAKMGLEVKEPERTDQWDPDPNGVPMMYRAQVQGRCSLHDASRKNTNLDDWTQQWTYPRKNGEAGYQRKSENLGEQGSVYRIEVEFPFRLFSNCGQDSIARPVMGKDGIPFLPGSSVKGLFICGCSKPEQVAKYCGREQHIQGKMQHLPGSLGFRFHGAYPLGNWAKQMVDLVHPQGSRQVGTGFKEEKASASALISLYQPRMVFEFSCENKAVDWKEVKNILLGAIQLGVGGKTSSGYGMGGNFPGNPLIHPKAAIAAEFKAKGVSSLLRDGSPEFRPNAFKAGLRGHLRRLLSGVSNQDSEVKAVVERWFGHQKAPAAVSLFWEMPKQAVFEDLGKKDRNPTYSVQGTLYADIARKADGEAQYRKDAALLKDLVMFAYVMGGFGKSWRRVWHEQFLPDYHKKKFAIGCHWFSPDLDGIQTVGQLKQFLEGLYRRCYEFLGKTERSVGSMSWREAWHPKRVAVFCRLGKESKAVSLFHDDAFKTTPAIGGRSPGDDRPTGISSVWHRMLPLKNGTEFLEIVTVFYGDRRPWLREKVDQLPVFVKQLKDNEFKVIWGKEPI